MYATTSTTTTTTNNNNSASTNDVCATATIYAASVTIIMNNYR